ncbi:MAG: hypothetical protein JNL08_15985 [Planctomycetes bacterium]|nr:hypothetical protein [Planctomycetota bacterium]
MSVLVSLLLAPLAVLAPQGDPAAAGQTTDPARAARLTPAEQKSLHDKLVKYLSADEDYDRATSIKDREKTNKKREKTLSDFDDEWQKLSARKGDLLGSMADLRAVFENCFELPRPSFSLGQLRKETAKEDGVDYSFYLPKGYKPETSLRTFVVLPGTAGAEGSWAKPADYFAAVWDKTDTQLDTIFVVPHVPNGLELDPVPDYSREGAEAEEMRRNTAVFAGWGRVMTGFNVDRARTFLDCGRGACGFGLRFVSIFPDRFAGVVLRDPVAVDDIRLGSMLGMPVLMVKTAANAAVVDALRKRFEELTPGSVTVVDATDEYPHRAAGPAITEWSAKQRRNMTPSRVVIEPNHDRYKRAYWVEIDRSDPMLGAPLDARPRIEVTADRAQNRIVVQARGIERFVLRLNDDIVDLGKEFTVVVNDKAVPEKKERSFRDMEKGFKLRRDWDYLFPVIYRASVPKAAEKDAAAEKK